MSPLEHVIDWWLWCVRVRVGVEGGGWGLVLYQTVIDIELLML